MMNLSTGKGGPRRRQQLLCLGCVVLLITAVGLYAASVYTSRSAAAQANISSDFLQQSPGGTDAHMNGDVAPAPFDNNADEADDLSILHPESHIFRMPTTIHLSWNVTKQERAPDGVLRPVYLINERFPGPTIEARSGDELIIDVHNAMEPDEAEGISIHWHGLYMKGANEMDGVVGLSQCAIGPSETYTYRFKIDEAQSGTFWYHAHSGFQRADGLYGGLVVHRPVSEPVANQYLPQPERLLLVGDWYHRQANDVFQWYQNPTHYGYEPAPDSLLINGRGYFDCSMAVKARPVSCTPVAKPPISLERKATKLRIVNTGASAGFAISTSRALMKLLSVDGGSRVAEDTPQAASIGILYPGERVDIFIESNSQNSESSEDIGPQEEAELTVTLDLENFKLANAALTSRQSFPLLWTGNNDEESVTDGKQFDKPEPVTHYNLAVVSGATEMSPAGIADTTTEKAVVYTKMSILSGNANRPTGYVNHTAWVVANPKSSPLLALDRADWEKVTKQPNRIWTLDVPWYRQAGEDRWMELVINNQDDKGHVFHMHGYDFYVVSTFQAPRGYVGSYNPWDPASAPANQNINTVNPIRKDTIYVPATGHVVLRFPLSNEGLWLLHCHVIWHLGAGMGIVMQVGDISEDSRQKAAAFCSKGT